MHWQTHVFNSFFLCCLTQAMVSCYQCHVTFTLYVCITLSLCLTIYLFVACPNKRLRSKEQAVQCCGRKAKKKLFLEHSQIGKGKGRKEKRKNNRHREGNTRQKGGNKMIKDDKSE